MISINLNSSTTQDTIIMSTKASMRNIADNRVISESDTKKEADQRPIAIDFFSGVGGMSLGFHQAGFNVVAAVDNDPLNTSMYKANFGESQAITADISDLKGGTVRELAGIGNKKIDVVFGGPPCQGFSFIGKRNKNDPRNTLLQQFGRLIGELQPDYFVVENVKGILTGYALKAVESFLKTVKSFGYDVVKPIKYLEAQKYGVPQKRQRVFILGYKKGLEAPKYPKPQYGKGTNNKEITVWDAIKDLPNVDKYKYLINTHEYGGKLGSPSTYAKMMRGETTDPHNNGQRQKKAIVLTGNLRTDHNDVSRKRFSETKPGTIEKVSRFYRLTKDGLSNTIRAGSGPHNGGYTAPRPIHPTQSRCITVREAARLHSFPDWFTFHPTKWHGFRQVGNAVPPRLACAVASQIFKIIPSRGDS